MVTSMCFIICCLFCTSNVAGQKTDPYSIFRIALGELMLEHGTKQENTWLSIVKSARYTHYKGSFNNPKETIQEKATEISTGREGDLVKLRLNDGRVITYPASHNYNAFLSNGMIYFESQKDNQRIILNEKFEPVLPEEYSVRDIFRKEERLVVIWKRPNVGGLYHLSGRWLLGPIENAVVNEISDYLYSFGTTGSLQLYTLDFKPLNDRIYSSIKRSMSGYIEAMPVTNTKVDIYSTKGHLLNEGQYAGIIQRKGNRITLVKNQDDKVESCVVDTTFRLLSCYPYPEIFPIQEHDDLLIVKELYDYGVIRRDGSVLIPFMYKSITYHPELDLLEVRKNDYLNDFYTITGELIGKDIEAFPQPKEISGHYISVAGNYKWLYNQQLKKFINIPADLGTLYPDDYLLAHDLLMIKNGTRITFMNGATGVIYSIP